MGYFSRSVLGYFSKSADMCGTLDLKVCPALAGMSRERVSGRAAALGLPRIRRDKVGAVAGRALPPEIARALPF